YFFFQAEDGIRDFHVTGVQTCALPILRDGEINDPHWYVKIYGIPEDAEDIDIFDEKLWYEVNPSLGHTISIESLRQEALLARNRSEERRVGKECRARWRP